ncbi:hypothetical protein C8A03DRAFT_48029 [Achaetomium macrosporum]|uniref:Galactose oxidase n=1 Tax=Achaetomium macrosporum TaxID=79813 RepID=A0AAN7H9X4_9PEZI|nr:hypothetical protein C8A03DRAFT_48029 [Achaetomium macrosporum]
MELFTRTVLLLSVLHGMLVQAAPCNPRSPHWKALAPIPLYPRQEHTTLALNSTTLAILGGIIPITNSSPPLFTTTPLLQLYDIPTNKWHPAPAAPAPIPINHPNAVVVNSKLYLLGGLSDAGDGVWRGTNQSFVYDIRSNTWSALPPMPASDVARGSAAMGVDEQTGVVYLAGGMTQLPLIEGAGVQESVAAVSAFDTRTNQWVSLGSLPRGVRRMPGRRDHAGAAVVQGVLYVLGGRDTGQTNVRGEVFALNLRDLGKGWVTKKGVMPTPRGGVSAAAVGGKVYVFGGEGNPEEGSDGVFGQVEAYDTRTDSWERLGRMRAPRHGTSAVAVGRGVYIPGGGIRLGGAPVDTFDVFYPEACEWL